MTSDPLERSVISYIHGQFVIMDEKSNVADAVKWMNKKNAETIIVTNNEGKPSGIITDSDILDKVVMTGEDSDQIFIKSIMSYPVITISVKATVKDALGVDESQCDQTNPSDRQYTESWYNHTGIIG